LASAGFPRTTPRHTCAFPDLVNAEIPLFDPSQHFVAKQHRRPVEIAFWPVTLLPCVLTPTYLT
jgi:hypothetical protein